MNKTKNKSKTKDEVCQVCSHNELNKINKEMYELVKFTLNKFTEIYNSNKMTNKNKDDVYYKTFLEVTKVFKIQPKKRDRRHIPDNQVCMGRKLDTLQCTRRRLPGKEYCKSHAKKLTNGRIDEPIKKPTNTGKRGRKRKNKIDNKYFDDNYKTLFPCVIEGKKYLSDIQNNIFKFIDETQESVKFLGVLNLEGKIESKTPNKC